MNIEMVNERLVTRTLFIAFGAEMFAIFDNGVRVNDMSPIISGQFFNATNTAINIKAYA